MFNPTINPTTSRSVVPSRQGVDGPRRRVATNRSVPHPNPSFAHFRFVTGFNAFNGFLFYAKPGITQPVPEKRTSHPGSFMRKCFQSHILELHPTFRAAEAVSLAATGICLLTCRSSAMKLQFLSLIFALVTIATSAAADAPL